MAILLVCTLEVSRVAWLPQFVAHYRAFGVDRFLLSLHTPPELGPAERERSRRAFDAMLARLKIDESHHLECDYTSIALLRHHDALVDRCAGPDDWIVWCDSDEFQVMPLHAHAVVEQARAEGIDFLQGVLVDRLAADWTLAPFDPDRSVWETYPRVCSVTNSLVKGDTRKVTLAHRDVRVQIGHHLPADARRWRTLSRYVQVHHFKWDSTVVERLRERLTPAFRARCPWWTESQRLLDYFASHGNRIDPADVNEWHFATRDFINVQFQDPLATG